MAEYIECRKCNAPSCKGCNTYILSQMLHHGKFNCLMDEHHTIRFAADVAPVVHGRWIARDETFTRFMCSNCKSKNHRGGDNYCPNFGAKMDLKGGEG